jgi:hypothetical protein
MTEIIKSWGNVMRTLVVAIIVFAGAYLVLHKILDTPNLNISVAGSEIRVGENDVLKTNLISPHGWTNAKIDVKKGDKLIIDASGSVNVSFGDMAIDLTNAINIAATKENGNVDSFTKDELWKSTLTYPWNGPEGIEFEKLKGDLAKNRVEAAKEKLLFRGAKVGQLLILNHKKSTDPQLQRLGMDAEVYKYAGTPLMIEIKEDGRLFFGVNDIVLEDKANAHITWQDNIGYFSIVTLIDK